MSQLRYGARRTLDYLYADLREIVNLAHNPEAVQKLARRCIERIEDEIEPKLQREAPATEKRIDDLEQRITRLEQEKVIVLEQRRKEA